MDPLQAENGCSTDALVVGTINNNEDNFVIFGNTVLRL
jgi:hypothetical protein